MQRERRVRDRAKVLLTSSKDTKTNDDDDDDDLRTKLQIDECMEDTFGEAYDDLDPIFHEDEEESEDAARRVLSLAKIVNADLERIEHMFDVYRRKCEEKDERDRKQHEEEVEFKKNLRSKFRESRTKGSNYFRKTKILLGLERDTAVEFAAFRERESRLFYRERNKTMIEARKTSMTLVDPSDNESEENDSDNDMTFRKTVVFSQ